jgi:MFS family permease
VVAAYAIFNGAEVGAWIALMIYAFEQGGAAESGVVAVAQLLPAGILAPLAASLAERFRPERVLAAGYWIQSGGLALGALTLALGGPALLVYACVGVMSVAISSTRPAQALVTPRLARTVDELTALNVVAEWATQGAAFVAPAITAVLLSLAGAGLVFAVFAALLVVAALAVPTLGQQRPRPTAPAPPRTRVLTTAAREIGTAVGVAFGQPTVRLVLAISAAAFVVVGALDVLTVALVVDRFDGVASTAAWLTAALGAGGIIGGAAGSALVGRRLAPALTLAAIGYGSAVAMVGIAPNAIAAVPMLFVAGVGHAVAEIASNSLLQRCAPSESVGEAFAVRESLFCLGLAAGAIAAPALIAAIGIEGAFVAVGAVVPAVVLCRLLAVWRLDRAATVPVVELSLLRSLALFRGLPAPSLEGLARNARPVSFPTGSDLMVEGELGDRYLAIVDGEVEVLRRGATIAIRSRGDGVGETALLRDVPRTATVRARVPVRALAITKDDFLVAVTGHPATHAIADDIAARRVVDDPSPD